MRGFFFNSFQFSLHAVCPLPLLLSTVWGHPRGHRKCLPACTDPGPALSVQSHTTTLVTSSFYFHTFYIFLSFPFFPCFISPHTFYWFVFNHFLFPYFLPILFFFLSFFTPYYFLLSLQIFLCHFFHLVLSFFFFSLITISSCSFYIYFLPSSLPLFLCSFFSFFFPYFLLAFLLQSFISSFLPFFFPHIDIFLFCFLHCFLSSFLPHLFSCSLATFLIFPLQILSFFLPCILSFSHTSLISLFSFLSFKTIKTITNLLNSALVHFM